MADSRRSDEGVLLRQRNRTLWSLTLHCRLMRTTGDLCRTLAEVIQNWQCELGFSSVMPALFVALLIIRYSVRSAVIGSIFAARRAGINPATVADISSTTAAISKLAGSYDLTPYS